jgi:hypothetical protein
VWRRRHTFTWRGAEYDQRERWFTARVAHFVPDGRGLTAEEREELGEWRWWSVSELAATSEVLVPRALAALLAGLLRDGPPEEPAEVGV